MKQNSPYKVRHHAGILLALLFPALLMIGECRAEAVNDTSPPSDGLFLEVKSGKERGYPDERIPLTITLLAGQVTVRNIQFPRLAGSGFTLSEFAPPREHIVTRDGQEFTAYEFSSVVTPRKSGALQLGPAVLQCELLVPATGPAAFFGESEPRRVTVRAASKPLNILPLPIRGKPQNYSGAVGRFTVTVTAQPTQVRVGDPVMVTTTIRGVGNLDTIPCPTFRPNGFRMYPAKTRRAADHLSCEQVVIPELAETLELAGPILSYFDPAEARYRRASAPPVMVQVSAPPMTAPAATTQPVKPHGTSTSAPAVGTAIAVILALLLTALFLRRLYCRRQVQGPSHSAVRSDPPDWAAILQNASMLLETANPAPFYTALYRALQSLIVSPATGQPAAAITLVPSPHEGLPPSLHPHYSKLVWLLAECDQVRFGRQERTSIARREALAVMAEILGQP